MTPERIAELRQTAEWAERVGEPCAREWGEMVDEIERLRTVLDEINQLRANVVATQRAGWSDTIYPLVAMLNRAGWTHNALAGVSLEQQELHRTTYGGAGGTPFAPLANHAP